MKEISTLQQWELSESLESIQEKYKQYISSIEWNKKKKLLIDILGNKCECCGTIYKLQGHHGSYSKLGNEPLHHIFILCDNCHEYYHKHTPFISIQDTELFISDRKGIESYGKIRRKILRKNGIKVPKSNY